MRKDDFAGINDKPKHGNRFFIIAAVLAICITGILYAVKLQADSKYVTLKTEAVLLSPKGEENGERYSKTIRPETAEIQFTTEKEA